MNTTLVLYRVDRDLTIINGLIRLRCLFYAIGTIRDRAYCSAIITHEILRHLLSLMMRLRLNVPSVNCISSAANVLSVRAEAGLIRRVPINLRMLEILRRNVRRMEAMILMYLTVLYQV